MRLGGVFYSNYMGYSIYSTNSINRINRVCCVVRIYKKEKGWNPNPFVVLPGFEPGQTEPKPVVLPLHHKTILSLREVYLSKAMQSYD